MATIRLIGAGHIGSQVAQARCRQSPPHELIMRVSLICAAANVSRQHAPVVKAVRPIKARDILLTLPGAGNVTNSGL